jgi:DamX protein
VPLVQTNSAQTDAVPKSKSVSVASSKKAAEIQMVKPTVAEAAVSKSAASNGFSDQEKAILSWSGVDYTLQLVGLSSEKSARDFIASQPNKKDLLLFKSKRQGKDWFVVVTGRYPSSAKARQAAQLLPDEQRKASPWPREVKIIQGEIRQY